MLYAMPALAQPAQSKPERFAGIAVVAGIHLALLVAVIIGVGPRISLPPIIPDTKIYPDERKKVEPTPSKPFPNKPFQPPISELPPPVIPVTPDTITPPRSNPQTSQPPSPDDSAGAGPINNIKAESVGIACPNSRSVRDAVGYPTAALREGIQGDVLVRFVVSASGQIRDIAIAQSSNRVFNSKAMAAVREFQCVAQARDVQVEVPFSFRLQ